jgi:hypothetical protein
MREMPHVTRTGAASERFSRGRDSTVAFSLSCNSRHLHRSYAKLPQQQASAVKHSKPLAAATRWLLFTFPA